MFRTLTVATSLSLLSLTAPIHAQNFPNRPMTMVVPFAAGGAVDVLGRGWLRAPAKSSASRS